MRVIELTPLGKARLDIFPARQSYLIWTTRPILLDLAQHRSVLTEVALSIPRFHQGAVEYPQMPAASNRRRLQQRHILTVGEEPRRRFEFLPPLLGIGVIGQCAC